MAALLAEQREEVRELILIEMTRINPATKEDLAILEGRVMGAIAGQAVAVAGLREDFAKLEGRVMTILAEQNVVIQKLYTEIHKSARQLMIWIISTILGAIGLIFLILRLFFWH